MYLNYSVACTERIPIHRCKEAKSRLTKKPKKIKIIMMMIIIIKTILKKKKWF